MIARIIFPVTMMFGLLSASAVQADASMHRALFLARSPFASLGFLKSVYSKSAAQNNQRVVDLSGLSCVQLPYQSEYWFIINHRNEARAGESGFFAITLSARAPSIEPTDDLRVYRSSGWIDGSGRSLPELNKDPSQLSIGAKNFAALHDDGHVESEPSRLQALTRGVGEWHAKPDQTRESSWANRRIFADKRAVESAPNEKLILGARLLKFSAIDSNISISPMVFGFNPSGMRSFRISLSAPGFDVFNQATEFRIGIPCEQTPVRGGFFGLFGN